MNGLPTPNEMAQRLIWLSKALDVGANAIAEADDAATRAELRYERAYATAVVKIAHECRESKSILAAEREAMATEATASERADMKNAARALRKAKEDQRATYAKIELARSLNSGIKVEAQLAGVGTA